MISFSNYKLCPLHSVIVLDNNVNITTSKESIKVTVVTGTYKLPQLLIPTIESLLYSTFKDFVLYIVDDNASNETEIIAEGKSIIEQFEDERIKYIKNDTNVGVPFVFRKWIELVKTPYFLIFGAGDRLEPTSLEKMVNFLDKNDSASFVYGDEYFDNPINGRVEIRKVQLQSGLYKPNPFLEFHLISGKDIYGWSQASAMYRTELFNYYDVPVKSFHYWDHYFHLKYLLFSKQIGYINENMAVRHVEPTLGEWSKKNKFVSHIETIYQAKIFIDTYEFQLISRNYPINKYRIKIALNMLKKSIHLSSVAEIYFVFSNTANIVLKLCFSTFVFMLMMPIKLFGLVFLNVRKLLIKS